MQCCEDGEDPMTSPKFNTMHSKECNFLENVVHISGSVFKFELWPYAHLMRLKQKRALIKDRRNLMSNGEIISFRRHLRHSLMHLTSFLQFQFKARLVTKSLQAMQQADNVDAQQTPLKVCRLM